MQSELNRQFNARLTVDGIHGSMIFGGGTERAVREFQSSQSIAVDGVVGSQTWSHMFG
ncbi:peptidoglycan-binding protein [Halalkalibacter sp. APA_J-10(15)]|uniref:peptidoglycan-binding protein n=1 Tax=Halalkalibacter sp. APA_J-10(15) TaxID=2933805 RepID=UPI0034D55860